MPDDRETQLLDGIKQLFELYRELQRARGVAREVLLLEMARIFAQLGFSDEERTRLLPDFLREIEQPRVRVPSPVSERKREVTSRIRRLAETKQLVLTTGAVDMLRVPIREVSQLEYPWNDQEIDQSVEQIMEELSSHEPEARLEGEHRRRTSIAVIRAFAQRYCRIPPFCARREQHR